MDVGVGTHHVVREVKHPRDGGEHTSKGRRAEDRGVTAVCSSGGLSQRQGDEDEVGGGL